VTKFKFTRSVEFVTTVVAEDEEEARKIERSLPFTEYDFEYIGDVTVELVEEF
jgi:hypothetical protein